MKRVILSVALLLTTTLSFGKDIQETFGLETTKSTFFEERYLYDDLVHYLDNHNLHITYEVDTTGEFNQPDQMVFSVDGNSFRWNKYYIDGFRIDSRFFAGSTLYYTNMSNYDLGLDYLNSELRFNTTENRKSSAEVSYNIGSLGGQSVGTTEFIRLLHRTAKDRAYKPIEDRNSVKGAGTADVNFAIKGKDRSYMQSVYINFGQRDIVDFDYTGIYNFYPETYGKFQVGGELPLTFGGLFDQTSYLAAYSQRDHLNSEFYYSEAETSMLNSYAVSLYGSKHTSDISYTSGFNFALNKTEHEDLNYSRNIADHDGEGFDPWSPDGSNIEISYSLSLTKRLNDWLNLNFDGYNSLMRFNTAQSNFSNEMYFRLTTDEKATALYLYEWESDSFYSGLLENSVGLSTEKRLSKGLDFRATVDLTLDAMLVDGGSRVSPNFEFRAGLDYKPNEWFSIEFILGRERVNYNIEDIQFMSNDYLNGNVYYINDVNGNGRYDDGEKGSLFTRTGGQYHSFSDSAKQPAYYVLDIPINVTYRRHNIALLLGYRKYCNNWTVGFDGDYSDYGYMEQHQPTNESYGSLSAVDVFYFDDRAQEVNYLVGDYPDGIMGDSFFTSSPFYFCCNAEYTYTAPKFMVSVNWQSYMVSGISSQGNGPLHNNMGSLSESSANPNTYQVIGNSGSEYKAVGRLNQDRAYIARIFASYQITPKFSMAINAKFKDGQPFSSFQGVMSDSGNQMAILPETSRGTNTADGNFGTREDGVYNIDVRAQYKTKISGRDCEFGIYGYNLYDFANELSEYTFHQDLKENRNSMSLTIPRGVIFSFSMSL